MAMTRYDFQLTLGEAEQLQEALYVQLQRLRTATNVHLERARDEHINKAHSLLKILERQIRDIEKYKEECARRDQRPEYLVGI